MWRDVKGLRPHVNNLVDIDTGDDEEDAGSSCSARQKETQPAQGGGGSYQESGPEHDGSLVLLDHLDHKEEGEGEGDDNEEDGEDDQELGTDSLAVLTGCQGRSESQWWL